MSHQAQFIHIICTDPRIQKIYHDYLAENNLFGEFDSIEYENPILDFLDEQKRPAMITRLKLYVKLHGAKKIVFFDHFDCGAYKEHGYKFNDEAEEASVHMANNQRVMEILKKELPEMEAEVKYIKIDGQGGCSWWQPQN